MIIRRATIQDTEPLAEIQVAVWRAAYEKLVPEGWWTEFTLERWEDQFRKSISEQTEEITVAEIEDHVRGYTIIGPCRDDDLNSDTTGEIWGLYVSPQHWGQGIGSGLTEWACRELKSRGYKSIWLWVFESNLNAREFYERRGFSLDGARKEIHSQLPPALRYRKAA